MEPLDPRHEIAAPPALKDLPEPHHLVFTPARHRGAWGWLFALVLSVSVSFILTLVLITQRVVWQGILVVVPIVFILATFLAHAAAERAK